MRLIAIFIPPLAVLLCRKPIRALLTVPLCVLFWFPAVIYAWSVVTATAADTRTARLEEAIREKGTGCSFT